MTTAYPTTPGPMSTISITILPIAWLERTRSAANGASSNANTESTIGRIRPSANAGRTRVSSAADLDHALRRSGC